MDFILIIAIAVLISSIVNSIIISYLVSKIVAVRYFDAADDYLDEMGEKYMEILDEAIRNAGLNK